MRLTAISKNTNKNILLFSTNYDLCYNIKKKTFSNNTLPYYFFDELYENVKFEYEVLFDEKDLIILKKFNDKQIYYKTSREKKEGLNELNENKLKELMFNYKDINKLLKLRKVGGFLNESRF